MALEFEDPPPPSRTSAPSRSPRSLHPKNPAPRPVEANRGGQYWRAARWVSRLGTLIGIALFIGGRFLIDPFEQPLVIADSVRVDPQQEAIDHERFEFEHRGHHYGVETLATYDLSGLIVTHNDISSITDAYHTSDDVDFRDICVVWGANVGSGTYRRVQFWSEPWSCHYKADDEASFSALIQRQVSNNHLLTDDPQVRSTILDMRVGDQVRLRGRLINYWRQESPSAIRKSSLRRDDTGNGACEVVWVEEAEILRRGSSRKHLATRGGGFLLGASLILGVLLFFITPLEHYRRFSS